MTLQVNFSDIVLNNDGTKDTDLDLLLPAKSTPPPELKDRLFVYSSNFLQWMRDNHISFLVSSYKTSKVFSIGTQINPDNNNLECSFNAALFNRPMGIHTSFNTIWVSSSGNLWKYKNIGANLDLKFEKLGKLDKYDSTYLPQAAYFSNDIDAHDICLDSKGNPYYCSATFCCICQPSETHSFKVYWKPPWISKVAPEDRCHLNGVCSRDDIPRYVTAVCMGDSKGSWRNNRVGKGVVYDMVDNKLVCEGLCMPHSPRWYRGELWILEAGTGWIGYVDFEGKKLVKTMWVPGYLRGMCFVKDKYMVVGSSEDRHENTFRGLPLGEELKKRNMEAICGFFVINMEIWKIEHQFQLFSPANEMYDVCVLDGVYKPRLIDLNDPNGKKYYEN